MSPERAVSVANMSGKVAERLREGSPERAVSVANMSGE